MALHLLAAAATLLLLLLLPSTARAQSPSQSRSQPFRAAACPAWTVEIPTARGGVRCAFATATGASHYDCAVRHCARHAGGGANATLLLPAQAVENAAIAAAFDQIEWWVGLWVEPHRAFHEGAAAYRFVTGGDDGEEEVFTAFYGAGDEPDNARGREHCAASTTQGQWTDRRCDEKRTCLCELGSAASDAYIAGGPQTSSTQSSVGGGMCSCTSSAVMLPRGPAQSLLACGNTYTGA